MILNKSMYGITNSGNIFSDKLTNWLIDEVGLKFSPCQISIYYKYAPDVSKLVVLSYVDYYFYWYTYEELGNCFLDTLGNTFHVNFLGYPHWFISVRIPQLKDHSISVDQARYAISVVAKYLDTYTIKENSEFHNNTLPRDIIFTK